MKPIVPALNLPHGSAMWRPDFLLGTATASYQIEGAVAEDGRLPSIWDTFAAIPGKVLHGDTGAVACDHYHRWEPDLDLITELGLGGYRLSIAWPRVMDAAGRPNPKGLDFYRRILGRLQEKGLHSLVTLYHWDLPQHLEDRGGWLNRDTAYRFAEYADLVSREFAGQVDTWATLNEPWCSAFLGYGNGHHAPGLANTRFAAQAMHHLLLAHGLALPALRANDPKSKKGIVANVGAVSPASDAPADADAAHLSLTMQNQWVLDPLLKGTYPADLFRLWPGAEPLVLAGDMERISQPIDVLGINYYFRTHVKADAERGFAEVTWPDVERTQMGWEVYPQGLRDLLIDFHKRYKNLPPIYITENGMSSADDVVDGRVHDTQRIRFLESHLLAVNEAITAGVKVNGYFIWSLMDNFEWAFGYERRFGITHVDYATQVRTFKDSALAVQAFLKARRETR
jgi:beta-glucosidase